MDEDTGGYQWVLNKSLLVSWDVVSMFPNIDNELGLGAVSRALNTRVQQLPSTDFYMQ